MEVTAHLQLSSLSRRCDFFWGKMAEQGYNDSRFKSLFLDLGCRAGCLINYLGLEDSLACFSSLFEYLCRLY